MGPVTWSHVVCRTGGCTLTHPLTEGNVEVQVFSCRDRAAAVKHFTKVVDPKYPTKLLKAQKADLEANKMFNVMYA